MLTLTTKIGCDLGKDNDTHKRRDHLVDAVPQDELVSTNAQLSLKQNGNKEPDGRKLTDDQHRNEFHNARIGCETLDEQRGVQDSVIDHAESHDLNSGCDACESDHLLSADIEVVVEVGVGSPATTLAEVMLNGLGGYRFADGIGFEEGSEMGTLGEHGVSESSICSLHCMLADIARLG